MAPNFCGFNYDDHSAFVSLNNLTMALSIAMLRPGGSLILKSFNGADEDEIYVHSLI
jgi:23S rRNA U2552 (ribose-2'-O)-methylase RlmE/FtsJ